MVGNEGGFQVGAVGKDDVGKVDEGVDLEVTVWFFGVVSGEEFQGTHGAAAEIAESLDRVKGGGSAAFADEPLINEEVAKFVGKAIGEEAGEAFEGFARKSRKLVDAFGQRHVNGGDFDSAAEEGGRVFEEAELLVGVPGHGTDIGAEKSDGG